MDGNFTTGNNDPKNFEVKTSKATYKVTFKPNEDIRKNVHVVNYIRPHKGTIILGSFEIVGHYARTFVFQQIDSFDELIDQLFI